MKIFPHRYSQEDDDLTESVDDYINEQYHYVSIAAPTKRIFAMQTLTKAGVPFETASWTQGFMLFRVRNDQLDRLPNGPYGKCVPGLEAYTFKDYHSMEKSSLRKNLQWSKYENIPT